jgi:hypothetical protein
MARAASRRTEDVNFDFNEEMTAQRNDAITERDETVGPIA